MSLEKLLDFFDSDMPQLFDFSESFDQFVPFDRDAFNGPLFLISIATATAFSRRLNQAFRV
jgi:hypothetical protein